MRFVYVLAALVVLAGCVQIDQSPQHGFSPMAGSMGHGMGAGMMHHVESEQEFIVEMIPHHQEAVDTARVIAANSENERLVDLAQRIVEAQTAEIQMMRGWLEQWYPDAPDPRYEEMMPPMTPYQGESTDVAFLRGMIMHHRMAVMMARQVHPLTRHDAVHEFSHDVIEVQTAEINEMIGLLEEY